MVTKSDILIGSFMTVILLYLFVMISDDLIAVLFIMNCVLVLMIYQELIERGLRKNA